MFYLLLSVIIICGTIIYLCSKNKNKSISYKIKIKEIASFDKFCSKCGSNMEYVEGKSYFDELTGDKTIIKVKRCSRKPFGIFPCTINFCNTYSSKY